MKKTIFIFGVSGFVGSNLASFFRKKYRVIGTYYKHPIKIPGVLSICCDVLNKHRVQSLLHTFRPDFTIYAVGLRSIVDCHMYPKVASALNTAGVSNVLTFSERYQSRFILMSSSYVFGGENKKHKVNDPTLPKTVYGESVASAEFFVQKSCLNYLIFRCSQLHGRSGNFFQTTWFEKLERASFHGQSLVCDNDIQIGHLDIFYLGAAMEEALGKNMSNRLIHLSSQDTCTYFEFAQSYARIFKTNESLFKIGHWPFLTQQKQKQSGGKGDQCYDLDLEMTKAYLDLEIPTVEASLMKTQTSLKNREISVKGPDSSESEGVNFI